LREAAPWDHKTIRRDEKELRERTNDKVIADFAMGVFCRIAVAHLIERIGRILFVPSLARNQSFMKLCHLSMSLPFARHPPLLKTTQRWI